MNKNLFYFGTYPNISGTGSKNCNNQGLNPYQNQNNSFGGIFLCFKHAVNLDKV